MTRRRHAEATKEKISAAGRVRWAAFKAGRAGKTYAGVFGAPRTAKQVESIEKRRGATEFNKAFAEAGRRRRITAPAACPVCGVLAADISKAATEESRRKCVRRHVLNCIPLHAVCKKGCGRRRADFPTLASFRTHEASCGAIRSPEHRAAIGRFHKGRKRTPETCARISAAKRGKPSHLLEDRGGDVYILMNRSRPAAGYKIGSARDAERRLRGIRQRGYRDFGATGDDYQLLESFPCDFFRLIELRAHWLLGLDEDHKRAYGEITTEPFAVIRRAVLQSIREIDGS